jgi:hypothetical protein
MESFDFTEKKRRRKDYSVYHLYPIYTFEVIKVILAFILLIIAFDIYNNIDVNQINIYTKSLYTRATHTFDKIDTTVDNLQRMIDKFS